MVSKSRKDWVMSSAVHPRERRRMLLYIAAPLCTALVLAWPEFFATTRKKWVCFYFLVLRYLFDWGLSSVLCSVCSMGSQRAHSHPSSSVLTHCYHWVVVINQARCAQPFLFLSKRKILLFRHFNGWNYNKKYLVDNPHGLFPYASNWVRKNSHFSAYLFLHYTCDMNACSGISSALCCCL